MQILKYIWDFVLLLLTVAVTVGAVALCVKVAILVWTAIV